MRNLLAIEMDQLPKMVHQAPRRRAAREGRFPHLQALVQIVPATVTQLLRCEYGIGHLVADQTHTRVVRLRDGTVRQPAGIDQDQRPRSQPILVIDGHLGMRPAHNLRQMRPHQGADRTGPERLPLLLAQRGQAAQQIERRPGQRQRFEPSDGVILKEANPRGVACRWIDGHGPPFGPCRPSAI